VNTTEGPTNLVRQDAILGGLSIGSLPIQDHTKPDYKRPKFGITLRKPLLQLPPMMVHAMTQIDIQLPHVEQGRLNSFHTLHFNSERVSSVCTHCGLTDLRMFKTPVHKLFRSTSSANS